jgi:antitoxin MazE
MAITRIGPKHQITIPQEVFEQLGLQPGDFLEVQVRDEALYLIPQKLVPRDQAWFWSKDWQERERETDEAIANGELSGPLKSVDDLIQHLHIRQL